LKTRTFEFCRIVVECRAEHFACAAGPAAGSVTAAPTTDKTTRALYLLIKQSTP
jgi:hypothetical protein